LKKKSVIAFTALFPLFASHILTVESFRNTFVDFDTTFLVGYISCLLILWFSINSFKGERLSNIKIQFSLIRLVFILLLFVILVQSLFHKLVEIRIVLYLCLFYGLFELFRYLLKDSDFKDAVVGSFLAGVVVETVFLRSGTTFLQSSVVQTGVININRGVLLNHIILVIPFLISAAVYFGRRCPLSSIIAITFAVLCSSAVIRSDTRIAWLALIAVGLIFFKDQIQYGYNRLKCDPSFQIKGIFIVVLIATGTIVFTCAVYNYKIASSKGHLLILNVTAKMWSTNPVTGIGLNRFPGRYNHFQAQYLKKRKFENAIWADNTFYAFNEYLQALVEEGIVGILFFAISGYVILIAIINKHKDILFIGACAGIVALSICCLTSYPLHSPTTGVFAAFYLAIIDRKEKAIFSVKMIVGFPVKICASVALLTILACFNFIEFIRYKALKDWSVAAVSAFNNKYDQANSIYKRCYPILRKDGGFLFNYGAELSIAGHYSESIKILNEAAQFSPNYNLYIYLGLSYERLGNSRAAEDCYQYADEMIPSKYLGKYLLLHLYDKMNKKQKAIALATSIIKFPVKIPSATIDSYKTYAKNVIIKFSKEADRF